MATYKTLLIHTGELKPEEQIYWNYDLFECATKFVFGLLCPPYFQTRARLNIIKHIESNENCDDIIIEYGIKKASKCIWITGYWLFWALCIIFLCLEYVLTGFFYLGLTMYCFYYVISVMNRNAIKTYYNIDSSHVIFDICSWGFCCCCAVIQEDLQSIHDIDHNQCINQIADEQDENGRDERLSFLQAPVDDITDAIKQDAQ